MTLTSPGLKMKSPSSSSFTTQSSSRSTSSDSSSESESSPEAIRTPSNTTLITSSSLSSTSAAEIRNSFAKSTPRERLALILRSDPTNRNCADCRINLGVGLSDIHLSFHRGISPQPANAFEDNYQIPSFKSRHTLLTPPTPSKKKPPAKSSHAVFICEACSLSHASLGPRITSVKSLLEESSWQEEELDFLECWASNGRQNRILEQYMPEYWKKRLLPRLSSATKEEREVFVRAKYEALAFLFPRGPFMDGVRWRSTYLWAGYDTNQSFLISPKKQEEKSDLLPSRLVDYFCVIGPDTANFTIPEETTISQISFPTKFLDCYPDRNHYTDLEIPVHTAKFVFPDGCKPSPHQKQPTFFSFVFTLETGLRLYGANLTIYDTTFQLPNRAGEVFLPRALIVLSHYPFHSAFRSFLTQLYRISLAHSPLPIERYVTNFVKEVPLPPQGKMEVQFGFCDKISISRPPKNKLPLMNSTYRPLFATLSVGNVIVIVGLLLQETRVVLCSQHYALLTPISEALLSLLFPFIWQGAYIPIMPYNMLEILDAPMPFLVGLHSRYLKRVSSNARPTGVVFVDVDEDIVHLGTEDEGGFARGTPALPEKDAIKLKTKLEEHASCAYLKNWRPRGQITYGINAVFLSNDKREMYAHQTIQKEPGGERREVLEKVDEAFWEREHLMPIENFMMEQGTLVSSGDKNKERSSPSKARRERHSRNAKKETKENGSDENLDNLFNLKNEETGHFSATQIRTAFLRFFVSLFKNYEKFLSPQSSPPFLHDEFLNDFCHHASDPCREFMSTLVQTQMFERFVVERIEDPKQNDVMFFDQSILAKKNRSKKGVGGWKRKEMPFFEDHTEEITDIYTPPPPSNWGLPDDGRTYSYPKFPSLKSDLFGKARPPKTWKQNSYHARHSHPPLSTLSRQQRVLSQILQSGSSSSSSQQKPGRSTTPSNPQQERNVEWAIHALAYRNATVEDDDDDDDESDEESVRSNISTIRKLIKKDEHSTKNMTTPSPPKIKTMSADILCTAQGLISTARRKQIYTISLIVKIQAQCRLFVYRQRFLNRRNAAIVIQKRFRLVSFRRRHGKLLTVFSMNIIKLQRLRRGYEARKCVKKRKKAGVLINQVVRSWLVKRKKAGALINRVVRSWLVRVQLRKFIDSMVKLQALMRGRRVRFIVKLVIRLVVKVQAIMRGVTLRQLMLKFRTERIERYRKQMVELWKMSFTPLVYRSKFWVCVDKTSFLHLALHEEELGRLWEELGFEFEEEVFDVVLTFPNVMNEEYRKYCLVKKKLTSDNPAQTPPMVKQFSQNILQNITEKLSQERLHIYEKMCQISDQEKSDVFSKFDISFSEKKKKQRVAEMVWKSYELASQSAELVLYSPPEDKEHSTSLIGTFKVNKIRKKFGVHNSLTPRITAGAATTTTTQQQPRIRHRNPTSSSVQEKIDLRIKGNMKLAIQGYIKSVQSLTAEADERTKKEDKFERQRDAIFETMKGWYSNKEKRLVVIRQII